MKKLLLVLVAVLGLSFAANAQNIGGRFGGVGTSKNGANVGYNAELSYQHYLSGPNRLEFDLGFSRNNDNYINFAIGYHWLFPIAGDFSWFIGPAVNLGYCNNDGIGLAAGAQGGAEWNPKNAPIQLAVDFRPVYEFILPEHCYYNGFGYGVAFSVRYRIH